jgi:hypothetical protein
MLNMFLGLWYQLPWYIPVFIYAYLKKKNSSSAELYI